MQQNRSVRTILITGLALFAMFFGAGNLIFPVMIGAQAGVVQLPATLGFLATGVLLPMAGMIAAATSSSGVLGIAERVSHYPGLVFCWMIFLSTGVLYAIPRTATVSFEMSFQPLVGNGWLPLVIYAAVFFIISGWMALNPTKILEKIGGWLTPALLVLLLVLIVASAVCLEPSQAAPSTEYASTPVISGLLQGYNTMDAIASFVFGVVIIKALRSKGCPTGRPLFTMTALCGVVAAVCLGVIYFGLSMLGRRAAVLNPNLENGAQGLVETTRHLFGPVGSLLLGLIAFLACLTTSIGLIGASIQFFQGLFPQISRRNWVIIHALVSFLVANLGLNVLLQVVVPIMYLCYPITICLVITCIVDIFIPGHMFWAYRMSVWVAAFFGLLDALKQAGIMADFIGSHVPLAQLSLGWVIPASIGFVIGIVVDILQGRMGRPLDYDQIAWERNQQLMESGLAGVGASEPVEEIEH